MKQSNTLQATINNKIITTITVISVFFMVYPARVQAQQMQGLQNTKSVLEEFQTELDKIIPIAAAVILLSLAIGYAERYIKKDTFVRWAIGVVMLVQQLKLLRCCLKFNEVAYQSNNTA
nr:VirB2 family type IV secretion system major pilin TrwL [Bartonella gliris]